MTPTGFEAELRTRKNVGIIGDFAIFNEEIMKKNRAFFSPIFSNFSVKKTTEIIKCFDRLEKFRIMVLTK